MVDLIIHMKGPDYARVPGSEVPADNVFPLFDVYSDIVNARGGTPVPESNTRYWDKPTYPTTGTIYASEAALNAAIATANPGDILRLANGTYNNMNIDITVNGTGANPITVAAQTKGGVTLTGASDFDVTGNFVNVMGFAVTGANNQSEARIFEAQGTDIVFSYNSVTAVDSTGGNNKCFWMYLSGNRCRACYNTFNDKQSGRSPIRTDGNTYLRIDHNKFIDIIGDAGGGDQEVIQFSQNNAATDMYGLADNNYVLRYNNVGGVRYTTEREIISNKASSNIFIQNVLVDCIGHMFDRTSHRATYYGNWIDGGNLDYAGGIGLSGNDAYAFCNYITLTGQNAAWTLTMRDNNSNYEPSVDNQFAFNMLIDCESSMGFSTQGAGGTNSSGIQVYNNAIDYGAGDAESVTRDVYDGAGTWGGNVFKAPDGVAEATTNAEILAETPQLTLDNGYYVPTAGGNCRGTGSTAHHALCTVDILGNTIPGANPNVGCFQDGWDLSGDPRQQIINEAGA
jgi:hypothetical protein